MSTIIIVVVIPLAIIPFVLIIEKLWDKPIAKFIVRISPDKLKKIRLKALKKIKSKSNVACIRADEIFAYLNEIYSSHLGQIWLYNNDLQMFEDSERFQELYEKIYNKSENIKNVKIVLNEDVWNKFFDQNGEVTKLYFKNLRKLSGSKIESILLRKIVECPPVNLKEEQIKNLQSCNWIFYAIANGLRDHNVICMVRPISFPYSTGASAEDDDLLLLFTREMNPMIFRRVTSYFHTIFEELHFQRLSYETDDKGINITKIKIEN